MPYVTAADIEARLGGNVLPEQKAGLTDALTSACEAINVWCKQTFTTAAAASARTYTPVNDWRARVDPFYTTTGLIIQTDTGDDGTFATTLTAAQYELVKFGGNSGNLLAAPYDTINALGVYFPRYGLRSFTVQVTAKWGWGAPPQNVIEATKILTVELWKRKDTALGVSTGGAHELGALRLSKSVFDQVEPLLRKFQRTDRTIGVG